MIGKRKKIILPNGGFHNVYSMVESVKTTPTKQTQVHPRKLTWIPKMMVWKRWFLSTVKTAPQLSLGIPFPMAFPRFTQKVTSTFDFAPLLWKHQTLLGPLKKGVVLTPP